MGSRRHGRNGRIYMARTSNGTAAPLAFQTRWSLDSKTDRVDVTAFGDSNKVYVAGLADAQGTFQGFLDSDSDDHYAASQDGLARKVYLYPDITNDATDYWFGTAFFDFGMEVPVAGANTVSGSWAAASPIIRVSA